MNYYLNNIGTKYIVLGLSKLINYVYVNYLLLLRLLFVNKYIVLGLSKLI